MKVQCELCREIVALADFTPSAEGLQIRCPACAGTYFVQAPVRPSTAPGENGARDGDTAPGDRPGAPGASSRADETSCPKCGRSQPPTEACRHCGLVFALWDPDEAAATSGGDEEAKRLFALAEVAWNEPKLHEAFIEHCSRTGQLPFAARSYRARLGHDPADAVAQDQLQKVATVAELTCLTRPRELADSPVPYRTALIVGVVVLFLVLLGLLTSPLWRWWH